MAILLLVASYIALTAADFATTLIGLRSGNAVELNPAAAHGADNIRIGFLVVANIALLLPLVVAFAVGIVQAHRVPRTALSHWWRHVLDIFYVSPLNDHARQRRPLRLVTAAMTLLVLKLVIVGSNLLVIAGHPNPTTLLAVMWTHAGLEGPALYWAAYGVMIVPCYIAAVGLAAATLKLAQRNRR
ncbi:DUF5658 family protein [Glacieibacterium frigidum]|uniref:Uncharacterized protein n=1 Tax=Glacieibacterium frigidum TaxID=2593303 RepID=A0A552UGF9_9SPHN|nr:DUF5658 family protein [Glacieibacterium frigidum]TRW17304.1 hypothetical protein FMM06_03760 [Glacieibacterium frigidum]